MLGIKNTVGEPPIGVKGEQLLSDQSFWGLRIARHPPPPPWGRRAERQRRDAPSDGAAEWGAKRGLNGAILGVKGLGSERSVLNFQLVSLWLD